MRKKESITLGKWIIKKYNTKKWREGLELGTRKTKQIQELLDLFGRKSLEEQVEELTKEGYLFADRKSVNTEIIQLHIKLERLGDLCEREGIQNPRDIFALRKSKIEAWLNLAKEEQEDDRRSKEWIIKFYTHLLGQLERATKELPQDAKDLDFLKCLNELAALKTDMWKRQFSAQVLGNSKVFEDKYQRKVATVLINYSDLCDKEMEVNEILAIHGLYSYSQTLECKGTICYHLDTPLGIQSIVTSDAYYGHVLNAQTLSNAKVVNTYGIQRVITIENKANYENMVFDPSTLYIFTHGFMSFKERVFLKTLWDLLPDDVQFYHWSDMDYGGFRIFKFMKERVFENRVLRPWKMGKEEYQQLLKESEGTPLTETLRRQLTLLDIPELEELKSCILLHGKIFEQEQLMEGKNGNL